VVALSILAIVIYWGVSTMEKMFLRGLMHGSQSAGR
jgi:hypothetical protein